MFRDNDQTKPQYVCSTQPLASLLSRDSFLCFDGDCFGFYYPWRGQQRTAVSVDAELQAYLLRKGAFTMPPVAEQRRLVSLFVENLYPLYPVVERDVVAHVKRLPPLLLNAIFLAAVRYDPELRPSQVRARLAEFYERCKLLEQTEENKIVMIQAFVLLSMHEEGMEGLTSAKTYIAKACNLCGELCLTNMNGAGEAQPQIQPRTDAQYSKQMLRRIFWTTFCSERMISATSGREMVFNRLDLSIGELTEADFDEGPDQKTDFALFQSWSSLCVLIERIQCSLYRPPPNRSTDPALRADLSLWRPPTLAPSSPSVAKIVTFLQIAHCYARLLHIRSEIDSISLLLSGADAAADSDPMGSTIAVFRQISESSMRLVDPPNVLHNVLVVHVVLHVIAILQLEVKVQGDGSEFKAYLQRANRECIGKLKALKDYWWYASTALGLCETIFGIQ